MDDEDKHKIGDYIIDLSAVLFVFIAYLIGHFVNTIPAELAVMMASILGLTEGFIIYVIKKCFGIARTE